MRLLPILLFPLAAILLTNAGFAHAMLDRAVPAVGGSLPGAPTEIRLTFTQPINPQSSGIEIADADGRPMSTGRAAGDPADPKQLVRKLSPLSAGRYRVHWSKVSLDGDALEGRYTFDITGR